MRVRGGHGATDGGVLGCAARTRVRGHGAIDTVVVAACGARHRKQGQEGTLLPYRREGVGLTVGGAWSRAELEELAEDAQRYPGLVDGRMNHTLAGHFGLAVAHKVAVVFRVGGQSERAVVGTPAQVDGG